MNDAAALRDLPSVDQLLRLPPAAELLERHGRAAATAAIRTALQDVRTSLRADGGLLPAPEKILADAGTLLAEAARPSLRPVFNLTGTVLHTNLGRALLAEAAIEAATAAMRDAVSLEFDLEDGGRGERDEHVRALLCEATGAEAATAVNNNAAAVLLVLNTLAAGKESVVSRGELIEIGGAFRMPEIMARAGTKLVEVGTTNRTHAKDYLAALNERTGLVLKVHTSNYRVEGFTAEVSPRELAGIVKERGVPLVNDLGSGTLVDLSRWGLSPEPTVAQAVAEGADLVTFSGDKLLGGPQAGFIVGRKELIDRINRNPMKRALRLDKIRLAALEATLRLYRDPDRLTQALPTLRLLTRPLAELEALAARTAPLLAQALGARFTVTVAPCASQIGSGALPLETVPSAGLQIRAADGSGKALAALATALRSLAMPVIGRIEQNALVLDLRCLEDEARFAANLKGLATDGLA